MESSIASPLFFTSFLPRNAHLLSPGPHVYVQFKRHATQGDETVGMAQALDNHCGLRVDRIQPYEQLQTRRLSLTIQRRTSLSSANC
jgi:hypothetical protein